jgi:hypothetical protein
VIDFLLLPPRDHPIWTWIAILVVIFLLSLFQVTPTNEDADGVPW